MVGRSEAANTCVSPLTTSGRSVMGLVPRLSRLRWLRPPVAASSRLQATAVTCCALHFGRRRGRQRVSLSLASRAGAQAAWCHALPKPCMLELAAAERSPGCQPAGALKQCICCLHPCPAPRHERVQRQPAESPVEQVAVAQRTEQVGSALELCKQHAARDGLATQDLLQPGADAEAAGPAMARPAMQALCQSGPGPPSHGCAQGAAGSVPPAPRFLDASRLVG